MRSLWLFYGLAFGFSWLVWSPLWLPAMGVRGLPVFSYQHALGAWGPLVAAGYCTWRDQGRPGLVSLLRSMFSVRAGGWLAIAFFAPFLLEALAGALYAGVSGTPASLLPAHKQAKFPEFGMAGFLAYNLLFFGWGEETGWRGYALPRLQGRYNALVSALLLTLFWALWHVPLFLYRPGYTSMDMAGATGWVFSLLTGSVLLSWLFNSSRGSILVCAVFHSTIDVAFTSDPTRPEMTTYLGMLITCWGLATVVIFGWKNLSRRPRVIHPLPSVSNGT